jgi:hydrogenase maturation protease
MTDPPTGPGPTTGTEQSAPTTGTEQSAVTGTGTSSHGAPVLVLGVGNELFTDEGLGCVAAQAIARLELPGVEVLDGSTLGIALLPLLAGRDAVLLLDATVGRDAQPGDLIVLHGDEVPASRHLTTSAHQIGVCEALAAAELAGCRPPTLAAVGMVPVSLETGYGLSAPIADRIPQMVHTACAVLREWGVDVSQETRPAQRPT